MTRDFPRMKPETSTLNPARQASLQAWIRVDPLGMAKILGVVGTGYRYHKVENLTHVSLTPLR